MKLTAESAEIAAEGRRRKGGWYIHGLYKSIYVGAWEEGFCFSGFAVFFELKMGCVEE